MGQTYLRKYGVAATIDFSLYEIDGVDLRINAVHASGDTTIMKDEAAEASTTNGFTDEGKGYSLVLTATEMQAARIVIYIVDLTATKAWLDDSIIIETYGHASAMHAFDLDTALQSVNATQIEGVDATNQIRDAVVDDATRLDGSAINALSGHDPGATLCADGTPLTSGETQTACNNALVAQDLDHLSKTTIGAGKPATGTLFDKVMNKDGSQTHDASTDSLEAIKDNTATLAEMNEQMDNALSDIHLDHLLAVDYNPASKPGFATALFNELVENDAGVSRYTVNALENAPSGSGASAATIADAVWNESQAGHIDAGKAGQQLWTDINAILVDTGSDGVQVADKVGYTLTEAGIDSIHDEVIEGAVTLRQATRLLLSVLTGKTSGGGTTTLTFRDIGDTKNRVSATVDSDGNRTAIGTRDGS